MDSQSTAGLDSDPEIYVCESCGGMAFGEMSEIQCCDMMMLSIEPDSVDIDLSHPKFDRVLQSVFDLSLTSLEIIYLLMDESEMKAREITDELGYDRSTISRNLGSLIDVGLVQRRGKTGDNGGRTYLYSAGDSEELRRQFRRALYVWVSEVLNQIDEFVTEKNA